LASEAPAPVPLSARNLSISAGGETLVRDASFDVGAGEAVALVILAQEDATPLLDVLAGLVPPDSGEISWSGISRRDIEATSSPRVRYRLERQVRLEVGYVTPGASLLHNHTLFENIALPLRYHLELDEVELCSRIEDVTGGLRLEDHVLRRPSEVSRAVRRRASLARALALEPALLVVDSGYLDGDRGAAQALGSYLEERIASGRLAVVACVEEPARIGGLFTRAFVADGGSLAECRGSGGSSLADAVVRRVQRGTGTDHAKEDIECVHPSPASRRSQASSSSPRSRPSPP
jgi:ABC-type transporter Mla maintaining outer membrane lipid asymmetry ATPase subunit MlaF